MTPTDALAERILEQTAEAVIYANRQGVIERWNAAATQMFGYTAAEALGQGLDLIIPEHLRKAHWRGWAVTVVATCSETAPFTLAGPVMTGIMKSSFRIVPVAEGVAMIAAGDPTSDNPTWKVSCSSGLVSPLIVMTIGFVL